MVERSAIVLSLLALLAFAACSDEPTEDNTPSSNNTTSQQKPEQEEIRTPLFDSVIQFANLRTLIKAGSEFHYEGYELEAPMEHVLSEKEIPQNQWNRIKLDESVEVFSVDDGGYSYRYDTNTIESQIVGRATWEEWVAPPLLRAQSLREAKIVDRGESSRSSGAAEYDCWYYTYEVTSGEITWTHKLYISKKVPGLVVGYDTSMRGRERSLTLISYEVP